MTLTGYGTCAECGEEMDVVANVHSGCCLHEGAEPGDARNDPWYCAECTQFVAPEYDEDGRTYFEALYL